MALDSYRGFGLGLDMDRVFARFGVPTASLGADNQGHLASRLILWLAETHIKTGRKILKLTLSILRGRPAASSRPS